MIPLVRIRTKAAVPSSFRGATPVNRLVALMKIVRAKLAAGEEIKLDFESKWGVTKDQLLIETGNKCAYCETPTAVVAYGDVEHYRPKSKYWWLAYVYDNYLASCTICNQRFKSANYEHAGPAMPAPAVTAAMSDADLKTLAKASIPDPLKATAVSAFEAAHVAEDPLIPNPYIDDPEAVFAWQVIDAIQEAEVIPIPGDASSAAKVDASERIYGINRPELKRLRYDHYHVYDLARRTAEETAVPLPLRQEFAALVESMKAPGSAWAGMIRYFDNQRGPLVVQ